MGPKGSSKLFATQSVVCQPAAPEAGWQCQFPGPTPDLLNENLHFSKIPWRVTCTLKFGKPGFKRLKCSELRNLPGQPMALCVHLSHACARRHV